MTVALKGHYVNERRKFVLLNGDPFNSAPAGNITTTNDDKRTQPVHPRACGEHTKGE